MRQADDVQGGEGSSPSALQKTDNADAEEKIKRSIDDEDVEWLMPWRSHYKGGHDGTKEDCMIFEDADALAMLLINEVAFLNSNWWEKELPERIQNMISVNVNCNDIFAWGCADAQTLPYDEIETVYRMWRADPVWGAAKWCCIQRQQQPQKPVIKEMIRAGVWDEVMQALPGNTQDAEVHELVHQFAARSKRLDEEARSADTATAEHSSVSLTQKGTDV